MNRRAFLTSSAAASLALPAWLRAQADDDALAGLVNQDASQAIDRGLEFLANRQNADGSFGSGAWQGNVAVTGLSGLAFMAGGNQPGRGKYGIIVRRATEAILASEDRGTPGYLRGGRGDQRGGLYGHGFATLFLAEVHGMVSEPNLRGRLRPVLGRAIQLLIQGQNRLGGWRYSPRDGDDDLSATICQIMALRAARNAGIYVPKTTADRCIAYVKSCQDAQTGGFCYRPNGSMGPGFARTAAGIVALYSAGLYDDDAIRRGLDYLAQYQPGNNPQGRFGQGDVMMHFYYGHYYAAQAMWIAGPDRFVPWYRAVRQLLLTTGDRRPDGSWTNNQYCPEYSTAMALIVLQIPNNYLPILHR